MKNTDTNSAGGNVAAVATGDLKVPSSAKEPEQPSCVKDAEKGAEEESVKVDVESVPSNVTPAATGALQEPCASCATEPEQPSSVKDAEKDAKEDRKVDVEVVRQMKTAFVRVFMVKTIYSIVSMNIFSLLESLPCDRCARSVVDEEVWYV